jgi:hypothetical protein
MKKQPTSKETAAKKEAASKKPKAVITGVRLRMPAPEPIQIKHLAQLPKYVRPKRVHPRRTLPLVREGLEREFHSMTRQVAFHRALPVLMPMAATDELALVTNTELTSPTTQQRASNVGEPSAAINDQVVFYTGNWYAAMSSDGGKTFSFIDPATAFPNADPASSNFCCDQVVQYISKIDTFVWLMQYGPDTGDNIQRLAFASTTDVVQGRWRLFDITTHILNVNGAFMDFPDLAVGANCLYVTTNIFGSANQVGSAVIRIPFPGIQSGVVTAQPFVSMDLQSFRVAQNCGTTAFFAAHQDTSTLMVFSWDEAQSAPVSQAVGVARWIGGNGYQSRTPDGRRWLDRADQRITGATLTGNELWFAWSVDRGSNQRPKPFVQIARIDSSNLTLVENLNIFDTDSAICYAALGTNANNEVGVSYMIGGGSRFPSHVVGILTGTRKDVVVAVSDRGPLDPQTGKGEWGDYLTVRPVFPKQNLFAATGYTMKGSGDGSNQDATPRFVVFGRAGDTGTSVVSAGGDASTGGTEDAGGAVDGSPISDVNSLPVVSASVAAQIKAWAMAQGTAPEVAMAMPVEALPSGLRFVTKPGVERWPVKTGTDPDVGNVGKNVIKGQLLGAGIVPTTVEELIRIPRSADMTPPTSEFPDFQQRRKDPVETTIWQIEADIIALKQEADGDRHLVLQGASGQTMIGEIPTPRAPFVLASSPWLANMQAARQAVDDKLVSKLSPADFSRLDDTLVPRKSLSVQPEAMPSVPASFRTPKEDEQQAMPTFKTKVPATPVRITGVGFFDKVHGQMGVALLNGIELHPVLKIEWL